MTSSSHVATSSRAHRCAFVCCASAALAIAAPLIAAERAARAESSPYKITATPATSGAAVRIKVETDGPVANRYQAYEMPEDVTFDLTGAHIAAGPEHPMRHPFIAGEQDRPPKNIRIVGGVVVGGIPAEWNWFLSHAFGGAGFYTVATGLHAIEGARIHNVEDGWQPHETPSFKLRAYPNTARLLMRGCYLTSIRDDCIENDEFIPGDIEDSLFDGVHCFISEQNERQAGLYRPKVETIGPNESRDINLRGLLVRLTVTSGGEKGTGKLFKLQGRDSPVHHFNITDCVFATDAEPRQGGWKSQRFPSDATFSGTNYLLWLGPPGAFGGELPPQVKFLEGQAAKDKWHQLRNAWLVAHGYDPRGPDDWDPHRAPVVAPRRSASPSKPPAR
jgi:hypothetical protein